MEVRWGVVKTRAMLKQSDPIERYSEKTNLQKSFNSSTVTSLLGQPGEYEEGLRTAPCTRQVAI